MNHFETETVKVVGTCYVDSDGLDQNIFFEDITRGSEITLIRNPENEHDSNAIQVHASGKMLGHIPRIIAGERLAHILDSGNEYQASISRKMVRGDNVYFAISLSTFPKSKKTNKEAKKPDTNNLNSNNYNSSKCTKQAIRHSILNIPFSSINNLQEHFKNADKKCGIYCLWSSDHKSYIGQSKDIGRRWRDHYQKLIEGTHENSDLQSAWARAGQNKFRFDVIIETRESELDYYELYYIIEFDTFLHGYNQTPDGLGKFNKPSKIKENSAISSEDKKEDPDQNMENDKRFHYTIPDPYFAYKSRILSTGLGRGIRVWRNKEEYKNTDKPQINEKRINILLDVIIIFLPIFISSVINNSVTREWVICASIIASWRISRAAAITYKKYIDVRL
ncbi:GIY-YIG nuclease family protein [Sansalvadorimonas sp. 2012CJ34-2]|uniref:GIY-YIG nuclease family protein n=1 Tax=Parendozoicomonas callyspongiae TaxID=2942213 RepID=A0ABT0PJ98_9GAMM|nr:HIRAN domain-containing protein [Sansalvadorimonas sp. 2012CJ34-2]MCL6271474.1 GIY-YIG nuclease family protein [Sansalvadorimonas sp. 2012CJ34-2]